MSSKVFVYNQATPVNTEEKGVLELSCGLFFDGTRNKLENTEIRKKIMGLDDYKNPAQEERDIYNREAYTRSIKSLWLKKELIGDDSFANDFTNVARMKMACKKEYAIYIEGPGTSAQYGGSDDTFGYAFGAYESGIRAKVKRGCNLLAKKALKEKEKLNNEGVEIKKITLYVDVQGFSRGAAAARNFIYEIQKKAYYPTVVLSSGPTPNYAPVPEVIKRLVDSDKDSIDQSWLKEGKLPACGYLGVELLKIGFTHKEIEKIRNSGLKPRFLGIYDTVSSYSKHLSVFPNFENDVAELHLNDLGRMKNVVHFTAKDEHRENFSLTRTEIGIEKNFPGVHSDIGGSYTNGEETKEIENSKYLPFFILLQKLQLKLIKQYWFKPSQITLKKSLLGLWYLTGTRVLKKEYSYIPLHFMKDYAVDYIDCFLENYVQDDVETKYPIDDDPILVQSKARLKKYVMGNGKEWEFIPDKEIAQKNHIKKLRKEMEDDNFLKRKFKERTTVEIDKTSTVNSNLKANLLEESAIEKKLAVLSDSELKWEPLDEVVVTAYTSQNLLRKLRGEYLHWSADRAGIGFDPTYDRERDQF